MAQGPFSEHYRLTGDVASRSVDGGVEPRADPALTGKLPDDRLVARNDSLSVVLCLPHTVYPIIERGGPLFTSITTVSLDQTIDEIAASLDAVESVLDPRSGPATCYYGILSQSVQITSNTLERFLADLENYESIVADLEQVGPDGTEGTIRDRVTGACVWPTAHGTFYLQAQRYDSDEDFSVRYGILRHGIPLDITPIERFFDTIIDDPPTSLTPWPLRTLTISGYGRSATVRREPVDDAIVTPDSDSVPLLAHCGENPVYGVRADDIGIEPQSHEKELYRSLESISTLGYRMTAVPDSETYALDRIDALDLPVNNLCFVTASLKRGR
ncbi:hypothetical protein [Halomicrobium salinisoli]|uniref:hypothetical protein n=1 Tax=Halomicrobium salinisoli TaxID=2878391 RepID=UPI001CF0B140|nr:hypothetical protein [Halomicrobium salinisoli]